jgi:hypothetical protein
VKRGDVEIKVTVAYAYEIRVTWARQNGKVATDKSPRSKIKEHRRS